MSESPRWSLDSIFPGFDSSEYKAAKEKLSLLASKYQKILTQAGSDLDSGIRSSEGGSDLDSGIRSPFSVKSFLLDAIELQNEISLYSRTLGSYCYTQYSTNTTDMRAMNELNSIDELMLPFARLDVQFLNLLAEHENKVRALLTRDAELANYAFYLEEALFWQKKQMSEAEEDLAADLARSGADAWGRLQEQMTSTAKIVWEESIDSGATTNSAGTNGAAQGNAPQSTTTTETKTLVELRSLAYHADRSVRKKAYTKELELCSQLATAVAASINGVKGTSISLNKRRGWGVAEDAPGDASAAQGNAPQSTTDANHNPALQKAIAQGRLSPKALDALIGAMEETLPHWHRYLKAKARLLGLESCAFYDLFAPVTDTDRTATSSVGGASNTAAGANSATSSSYSWADVRSTIETSFSQFSPRLGNFARRAFEQNWIDAEPRAGKIGGAYCTDMPLVKETRVLANFDGAFNTITTVAHELGHAFHSDIVMDLPAIQQDYPMTLAETASIFAETIVFNEVLAKADASEKLRLLENHLQDGCQILVDILSRFYFERDLFAQRTKGELSAQDLCDMMLKAQQATYGEGLDASQLHPYMWLVKTHYYSSDLAFYNFPYAFGQLFGLALYARYQKEGPAFAQTYETILRETGRQNAVELTKQAGFDIESKDFWLSGIQMFIQEIDEFETLVEPEWGQS